MDEQEIRDMTLRFLRVEASSRLSLGKADSEAAAAWALELLEQQKATMIEAVESVLGVAELVPG